MDIPITASGGIDTWEHAVQMMMWGASSVGLCTAVMWNGFEAAAKIAAGIDRFVDEQGYGSYEEIVGLSLKHLTNTGALEFDQGYALVNPDKCRNCGACLKPAHCGAVVQAGDVVAVIADSCVGCGVCVSLCKYDAIRMVEAPAGPLD